MRVEYDHRYSDIRALLTRNPKNCEENPSYCIEIENPYILICIIMLIRQILGQNPRLWRHGSDNVIALISYWSDPKFK